MSAPTDENSIKEEIKLAYKDTDWATKEPLLIACGVRDMKVRNEQGSFLNS